MFGILKALALPSSISFLLAGLGLVLCVTWRTRRLGFGSLAVSALLLVTFSCGKVATLLLSPLEYRYPRVPDEPASVGAIVVLAAYATNDANMSLSDRPNSASLYRVVEAVHLSRHCGGCPVYVTGTSPTTDVMAELLESLGVASERVRQDSQAADTDVSADNLKSRLGAAPFYLVTSAGHMPRAMAVFLAAGLKPLAAPTDHRLPKSVADADWNLSVFHLDCSDLAVHERLAMWWYRMRGRI